MNVAFITKIGIMKSTLLLMCALLFYLFMEGQTIDAEWYSESETDGILIQNSFPKGGPYPGPTSEHFNYSYLVFFTRVVNKTEKAIELNVNFSADSVAIPNSPNTYMKLFLPPDEMSLDKQHQFSYGFKELKSFDEPTCFFKTLKPKEESLFYVVAIFYQTDKDAWQQYRGGNRAELVLKRKQLYYNLAPQVNSLPCGYIR